MRTTANVNAYPSINRPDVHANPILVQSKPGPRSVERLQPADAPELLKPFPANEVKEEKMQMGVDVTNVIKERSEGACL